MPKSRQRTAAKGADPARAASRSASAEAVQRMADLTVAACTIIEEVIALAKSCRMTTNAASLVAIVDPPLANLAFACGAMRSAIAAAVNTYAKK